MRLAFACVVSIGLVYAGHAAADSPKLKGEYAFTGSAVCLDSAPSLSPNLPVAGGFNANLTPVAGSRVGTFSFSVEGIRVFNGDGTGTVKGTTVGISLPGGPSPAGASASSSTFSARFTYTVYPDGTFATEIVPGTYINTNVAGPGAGTTSWIDTIPLIGLISNEAKTLTLASVEPTIETITYSTGEVRKRICHRSRVLVKVSKDKDKD